MEILNTTYPHIDTWEKVMSVILAVVAFGFFIFFVVNLVKRKMEFSVMCALGAVFWLCDSYWFGFVPYPSYIKHEVRITDMSKFDKSKYEIIEQRGEIFVVKELK